MRLPHELATRLVLTLLARQRSELEPPRTEDELQEIAEMVRWAARLDDPTAAEICEVVGREQLSSTITLKLHWLGEWASVLAWALGFADVVPDSKQPGDFARFWELGVFPKDPQPMIAAARLQRTSDDVAGLQRRLEAEADVWFKRNDEPDPAQWREKKKPKSKDDHMARSRIVERYRAVIWLRSA